MAEVLITLAIIGVVAALTIPTVVKNYKEKQTVAQVKKFYRNFASIVQEWQVEEGCTSNIKDCFLNSPRYNCDILLDAWGKKMNITKKLLRSENLTKTNWLPETTVQLDGTAQIRSWYGVSKNLTRRDQTCLFMLADGTTAMLVAPDTKRESGFMFFDVNGKKGPNRVGKDVFPIGIGAYNNLKYSSVNPHYSEDGETNTGGLCVIRGSNDCESTVDICTQTSCSPTAYVLKNDKLPPITW